ncbi:phosphotransferase family protein [Sanguibacter keddieii DSM 10542]|uniref:Phosphotransferase family protein n=1 Tax=Sanguibacter keddieii (strain ATCC 51767 / DSM 10542 / NCFB 3025 / ST-74) TaxID=446469 RepID=D1BIS0_SANKS|nr:aminoglycoside phosphotransferase family protein [Sanguibacter keddieii]ACZ20112.1 phosphotransferase family protein [Sanguibacter keddieii DSM 10542]
MPLDPTPLTATTTTGATAPVDPADADRVPAALAAVVAPLTAERGAVVATEKLDGGMFATTYRVTFAGGERVVAKMAPTATDRLMTYEQGILATEASVYRLAEDRPDLLMPRPLLFDTTREHVATDVLVASHLDGVPWHTLTDVTPDQRAVIDARLGGYMTRLHSVTGEVFGYPASPSLQAATWREAFGRMVSAIVEDAAAWGVELPTGRVVEALERHGHELDVVTRPALVHTDLWEGNIFLDPQSHEIVGVIDTERALFGDPLYELVGASQFGDGGAPPSIAAGYVAAGGVLEPSASLAAGNLTSADVRILLYRCYMYSILLVEPSPRGYEGGWVETNHVALLAKLETTLDLLLG